MVKAENINQVLMVAAAERRLVEEYLSQRWLYPLKDAARICGVSESKLRKDMAAGILKAKKLGSKVVIPWRTLFEYVRDNFKDWPDRTKKAAATK